jgi:hypothetical protein
MERGIPGILIIGQSEGEARLQAPHLQEAVDVVDASAVPVDAAVEFRIPQPYKMLRKPATRPIRPRVKIPTIPASRIFQQVQLAFQVGIENGAPNAMRPQAASQSRNSTWRLAGLGDGGVDEKEVGDGLPPFVSKRGFAICCLRRNDRMRVSGLGYREGKRFH